MPRFTIDPIRQDVTFGGDREPVLGALHQAYADAAGALLSAMATTDAPVRDAHVTATSGLSDGAQLDDSMSDGHVAVGGDLHALTIDEVISPSGGIVDHLGSAGDGIGNAASTLVAPHHPKPPDLPPGGPIAIPRALQSGVESVTGGHIPVVEGEALPWDLINSAVAGGAASEILRELGGPARIQRIQEDVAALDSHVAIVEKEQGPTGPQGPPGPQGPQGDRGDRGDRGQDGRDAQIIV